MRRPFPASPSSTSAFASSATARPAVSDTPPGARSRAGSVLGAWALRWPAWPIAAVLGSYIVAAVLLPTMNDVSISDDWTYARSVEYLVESGQFHILPVAAATQVFQLFWGALFALVFGMDFGALRLSTVALVFLSGIAMYGICRELAISRGRSALGAAVYLFNPVLFPITYSFMSDPHFLALEVIASYWYLRGLRAGGDGEASLLIGSAFAALACLQRPHGALIPLGVLTYLLVSRRMSTNRFGLATLARVAGIPAVTLLLFYLGVSDGVPRQQSLFLDQAQSAGWDETWLLIRRLGLMEMVYIGLFVLPIAAAAFGVCWRLIDLRQRRSWLLFIAWESALIAGVVWFWIEGRRMPFIPHFLGRAGPGSGDLRAARPPLANAITYDWLTIACVVAALLFGLALIRTLETKGKAASPVAGMAIAIAAWQAVGVLPQSFLFRNWVISLDRYLLPILPFAIALLLWALNDQPISGLTAWASIAAIGLFSTIGTRDVLVFQQDLWRLATELNVAGVPDTKLDAGYARDAYRLWEYGEEYDIPAQTPDGAWWTDVYARPTDSTYVIAGGPLAGYDVLSVHPYSAWLQREPVALYVLRRAGTPGDDVAWPPISSG